MVSATSTLARQSASGAALLTREEVVRLARESEPWRFVAMGVAAVAQAPGDAELRVLTGLHLAALGLRTPALEMVDALGPGGGEGAQRVRDSAAECADDAMAPGRLVRAVRAGCEVLAARGIDLRGFIPGWRARVEGEQWFLAQDGNVVRRRGGQWVRLADERGAASAAALAHLGDDGEPVADRAESPILFDGLDSPWLLLRVWETTPATSYGYQPRITLVVREVFELFDAMATADLRGVLADPRVELFLGEDADERLREVLESRSHLVLAGQVIAARAGRAQEERRVTALVRELVDAQAAESDDLRRRVEAVYAGRDASWWASRFAAARAGGEPLRVLIPTTANSTFLRHSAEDLAGALRAAGHGARVLQEPDSCSKLALPAYLRQFASWAPDLVVLLNYTRSQLGGAIPAGVPVVCWIQDRMGPLFDESVGRAQGGLDFVTGHMYADLFVKHGWPRERAWSSPVCASAQKFHGAPAAEHDARFDCEVAYVSHQSEPVEATLERFARAARKNPIVVRLLRELLPRLIEETEAGGEASHHERFMRALRTVRVKGSAYTSVPPALVWNEFGIALAERIVRHQTLRWAASVCERRGWRLRLFGRGWERSPEFSRYAAGELAHGEEVRACYQRARAHLHASIHTGSHQRVFECALSGGLALRRLALGDLGVVEQAIARRRALASGWSGGSDVAAALDETEAGRRYSAVRAALGLEARREALVKARLMEYVVAHPAPDLEQVMDFALDGAAETCFASEAGLEAMLERAITDGAWRAAAQRAQAAFVRQRVSYDAFVARLQERVEAGLGVVSAEQA